MVNGVNVLAIRVEDRETIKTDYLVIGSGISGLYFAMNAKEHGKVLVLAKEAPDHTNTNLSLIHI